MRTLPSSRTEQRAVLVRWPGEPDRREALAAEGVPCLLVVEAGAPIPPLGAREDWVRSSCDERDVAARLERLGRRTSQGPAAPPVVLRSELTDTAHRIAVQLTSPVARFVPRSDLHIDDEADDLDELMESLTMALVPLGLHLIRVGSEGFLLEHAEATPP